MKAGYEASTPRRKSRPICSKLARDFLRIRRASNDMTLVQLIRGKFAQALARRI
jgi:hypothetical protein